MGEKKRKKEKDISKQRHRIDDTQAELGTDQIGAAIIPAFLFLHRNLLHSHHCRAG